MSIPKGPSNSRTQLFRASITAPPDQLPGSAVRSGMTVPLIGKQRKGKPTTGGTGDFMRHR
jgi:hypothetical protein